jgi:carbamoyl-phosphate synthase small subunit
MVILRQPALLALADGSLFHGESIGISGQSVGEVVFNTAMTGYQEILTDPSYYKQIITLTYPHIGNVGVNNEDEESTKIFASGLIIRDLPLLTSNWRTETSLEVYLKHHRIVAIAGIDTRRLTRLLREKGAQNGCLVAGQQIDEQAAVQMAQAFPGLKGMDLAKEVSTPQAYLWEKGAWHFNQINQTASTPEKRWKVIAYDFGVKQNILRLLTERGCHVTVVPAQTPVQTVLAQQPDGVFLSNGPGDPAPCDYAISAIKDIVASGMPTFGICLGHQLLGLASGAQTVKMKFGHHGANHPVQDLASKRVMITSQNHGFAIDEKTLPASLQATHRSLFDGSLQGITWTDKPAFGFQGHPEASPGPHDVSILFDHFIELMKNRTH